MSFTGEIAPHFLPLPKKRTQKKRAGYPHGDFKGAQKKFKPPIPWESPPNLDTPGGKN